MNGNLTVSQIAKLEKLEAVITRGLQTFVDVGNSLCVIRDEKLHLRDFDTFEAYCQSRWGWSRQRSLQLINAAELIESLPPTLAAKVETERDARALLELDPKEQKQAIREAHKEGVPISEKAKSFSEKPATIDRNVTTTVVKAPKGEPQIVDETGCPIPSDLHELWARRNEVEAISREVAALKNKFLGLQCTEDLLWKGFEAQRSAEFCSNIHQALSAVRLFAVCVVCQGRGRKACPFCAGKGLISKFKWDTQATMEAKEIRKRSMAMKGGK